VVAHGGAEGARGRRILVIVPFPMDDAELANRRRQLSEVRVQGDSHFEYRPVKAAPAWFDSHHDRLISEMTVVGAGLGAEEEGFDAVVVDSVSDSGVQALRSVLDIPVIGPARAMYHTALMLGDRFSILTLWRPWIESYRYGLRLAGLTDRCASIRAVSDEPPDVFGLLDEKPEVPALLRDAAERCIAEDGADVILLGSTTMHDAGEYLRERLPVPVINPGPLSYKIAEACIDLGLTHAGAYGRPHAPKPALIEAMVEAAAAAERTA